MKQAPDPDQLSPSQLLDLVRHLLAENQQLRDDIERLKGGQSPLAPFAKKDRKANPQRPGRKTAQGRFTYRQAPEPATYSSPLIEVAIPHSHCPTCGGRLLAMAAELVTTTDVAVAVPQVTAYRVAMARCQDCGHRLRGEHPQIPASQRGATAHRLGSRALAAAHLLHYQLGIPVRKVPVVLKELSGLTLTQSALTQAALRHSEPSASIGQAYQQLRASLPQQRVIYTDDTGWREGAKRTYLMAFDSAELTVYQIRGRHRNEEVREVIGDHYDGVLTTDRGKSYDAKELLAVKQQKCLAHLQRSVTEALAEAQGGERDFCAALKSQLQEAQAVKRLFQAGKLAAQAYQRQANDLLREVNLQLRQRGVGDARSESLRQQLLQHHERGNLLRFLQEAEVEATNNAAERALRPAVIARKVSQGTKNASGSRAFEAFMSVIRTQMKHGAASLLETLRQLLERSPPLPVEAALPS